MTTVVRHPFLKEHTRNSIQMECDFFWFKVKKIYVVWRISTCLECWESTVTNSSPVGTTLVLSVCTFCNFQTHRCLWDIFYPKPTCKEQKWKSRSHKWTEDRFVCAFGKKIQREQCHTHGTWWCHCSFVLTFVSNRYFSRIMPECCQGNNLQLLSIPNCELASAIWESDVSTQATRLRQFHFFTNRNRTCNTLWPSISGKSRRPLAEKEFLSFPNRKLVIVRDPHVPPCSRHGTRLCRPCQDMSCRHPHRLQLNVQCKRCD